MSKMTLNDPKFNINYSLDTVVKHLQQEAFYQRSRIGMMAFSTMDLFIAALRAEAGEPAIIFII